ncbi:hypothetical protein Fmac_028184 [Flemingia macrophylla]|uniref:Uncharacterized protein n=1 Tax=Flemingia macrophylla TaxID=520843 RepID=A0ABD1L6S8_9FABA
MIHRQKGHRHPTRTISYATAHLLIEGNIDPRDAPKQGSAKDDHRTRKLPKFGMDERQSLLIEGNINPRDTPNKKDDAKKYYQNFMVKCSKEANSSGLTEKEKAQTLMVRGYRWKSPCKIYHFSDSSSAFLRNERNEIDLDALSHSSRVEELCDRS